MNKETMWKWYRKFTKADLYFIGFVYKKKLYGGFAELKPRHLRLEHESTKKGGGKKLQVRLDNALMEQFIRKGFTCYGTADRLDGKYNKGVQFEKLVSEWLGCEWQGKDSIPFYKAGDLTFCGKEVQVKMNGAQLVTEKTLKKLIGAGA